MRRLWMADAVLLGVYVMVAAAMAVLSLEPPYVTPLGALIALTLGGIVVVVVRHRHPRAAFAGALALALVSAAIGSGAEGMLPIGAMYLVGLRARASVAWSALAAALACAAAAALALTQRGTRLPHILGLQPPVEARDSLLDWLNFFSLIAALLLIATLLGINAGHRRRQLRELQHRAEQLARERDQQAETARARERERIAREMHDVIAHSLTVMIAVSDGARLAADENPQQAKDAIARVAETGRRTLGEVRRLLGTVRAGDDVAVGEADTQLQHAPQPDAGRLPALVQEFADAGLPVRLTITGRPPADAALGLTVYRIVQESLTNSLRHATDLQSVEVHVEWLDGDVAIVVQDTSASRPALPANGDSVGRGLLGMQERVALYNGTLEAGPQRLGWRVAARLHWDASEGNQS
ncbi:sensor histidine kinase [Microbacterium sp. nov. GSS16]|uniref:sensor histidine kinase n=1 Tax=Microbacterium sp. nov. GSS16 TaxID=3019890 RepID=UPI002306A266|nr:histidine kinase [Microbacterium sp. nov. GSS16]WCD93029.1 histidine kinase [Microbacterium sp. nov. GSS16]